MEGEEARLLLPISGTVAQRFWTGEVGSPFLSPGAPFINSTARWSTRESPWSGFGL